MILWMNPFQSENFRSRLIEEFLFISESETYRQKLETIKMRDRIGSIHVYVDGGFRKTMDLVKESERTN